jgi:hypothetical protein
MTIMIRNADKRIGAHVFTKVLRLTEQGMSRERLESVPSRALRSALDFPDGPYSTFTRLFPKSARGSKANHPHAIRMNSLSVPELTAFV